MAVAKVAYAGHKVKEDWIPTHPRIPLKKNVKPTDRFFDFQFEERVPIVCHSPSSSAIATGKNTYIPMRCVRITNKDIILSSENIRPTRMTEPEPEKFLCLSFAKLNFCDYENSLKLTSEYILRVLTGGIRLNGTLYEFCGHSNSQLQSRCCYLRVSYSTPIFFGCCGKKGRSMIDLIKTNGNFGDLKDISKCSKRIALLFTSSISNFILDSKDTKTIKDIGKGDKNFTDGCGFIDSVYAAELFEGMNTTSKKSWKNNLDASVLQIRYKGFKGIVMSVPTSEIERLVFEDHSIPVQIINWLYHWLNKSESKPKSTPKVLFRNSMKKFDKCHKDTFCILDHSKPFRYGYLNGDLITLLSTLGIPDLVFQNKLGWYLGLVKDCVTDVKSAIEFCVIKNQIHLVKQLKKVREILTDLQILHPSLGRLQTEEKDSFYKDGKVKIRIPVLKSRLLFGVCDPTGKLKPGECFVRYTDTLIRDKDYDHRKVKVLSENIIVSRNPCLHPGDVQHFTAVNITELNYLEDCIVFSVKGDIPPASTMSGGDLDGDKYFVCWDPELIPRKFCPPEDYSKHTPDPQPQPKEITHLHLIKHFSNYNTIQLGQIKSLYLKWLKGNLLRAASPQCIRLNQLHSKCVDGGRVRIPNDLKNPSYPTQQEFILSILERKIMTTFPCYEVIPDDDVIDFVDTDDIPDTQEEEPSLLYELFTWLFAKATCIRRKPLLLPR